MSQTRTCTQYTSATCAPTLNVNPSGSTLFGVALATGPWSVDSTCPAGQSMFAGREPTTGFNQQRPFYYTCATNLDHAKSIFASQQANQTWPLQRSQTFCNAGGNLFTTCSYFDDRSNTPVSAQIVTGPKPTAACNALPEPSLTDAQPCSYVNGQCPAGQFCQCDGDGNNCYCMSWK